MRLRIGGPKGGTSYSRFNVEGIESELSGLILSRLKLMILVAITSAIITATSLIAYGTYSNGSIVDFAYAEDGHQTLEQQDDDFAL